jgi:hypothetical protein
MFHSLPIPSGTIFNLSWEVADQFYGYYPGVMIDDIAGFGFRHPIDVGVTALLAPAGTIDSGTVVIPQAQITNYSNTPATFYTRMNIGDFYVDSQQHTLSGNDTLMLRFLPASLVKRGSWVAKCSTMFAGDEVPADDAMQDTINIRVRDVGVRVIQAPPETVAVNATFVPQAVYHNYGTDEEIFNCHFEIDSFAAYFKTKQADLLPGAETSMTFIKDSLAEGVHLAKAFIELQGDANPSNDTLTEPVFSSRHDVGATGIVSPTSIPVPGVPVPCSVAVENYGLFKESNFYVVFTVLTATKSSVYNDSLLITLAPSETTTVVMPLLWTSQGAGQYTAKAWTKLATDEVRGNDTCSLVLAGPVFHHEAAVTRILSPVGIIDTITTQSVKAIVANYAAEPDNFEAYFKITSPAHALIYSDSFTVSNLGSKDTETVSFKSWSGHRDTGLYALRCSVYVQGDTYHADDTMSAVVHAIPGGGSAGWVTSLPYMPSGKKNKTVNDGGALACNVEGSASYVYGLKGNNTTEFYQYNPGTNVWATVESIPWIGNSGKKKGVKAGAALASLRGKIYAVKGNGVNDFFQYNPAVQSGTR